MAIVTRIYNEFTYFPNREVEMKELSDRMIRLTLVETVAQMRRPDEAEGNLLIKVDELYEYVKTGSKPEINVEAGR